MTYAAEAGDVNTWAAVLSSVVQVGFSGLVGWYLLTKAIPKMQDQFLAEQKAARSDFDAFGKEARDAYLEHQSRQRQDHEAGMARQRADFRSALDALEAGDARREEKAAADVKEALGLILANFRSENDRRDERTATRDEAMRKELSLLNETVRELTTLIEERIK